MKPIRSLFLLFWLVALVGCGGTSSEQPEPVKVDRSFMKGKGANGQTQDNSSFKPDTKSMK